MVCVPSLQRTPWIPPCSQEWGTGSRMTTLSHRWRWANSGQWDSLSRDLNRESQSGHDIYGNSGVWAWPLLSSYMNREENYSIEREGKSKFKEDSCLGSNGFLVLTSNSFLGPGWIPALSAMRGPCPYNQSCLFVFAKGSTSCFLLHVPKVSEVKHYLVAINKIRNLQHAVWKRGCWYMH